ncbi:MAG: tripartite tricarboxylate transporter TctB family protein [Deltaproteobacteria bacterium]|nr:tripartite tricarboxylate transporter TctB family protein [Deltaproteobacteria bacterium]
MRQKSQRNHRITAISLFSISLLYFLGSFRLKMGTLQNPGPGLIPAVIGVLLVVCTAFYLVRVFWEKSEAVKRNDKTSGETKNYRAIVGILACTTVYPFILEPLKFILATFAAGFIMLLLLKPKKIFFSLLLALSMAVGAFLIFSRFFGVGLPRGLLENLLFQIGG